ncbi:unnamed protein product [Euphydryas editha]|uniref:Copia protein n=1 Tax=Euphydryas editha TaxID=104508 RepID=A0AAU9U717_EUPED|nr:unnamed protein product [Euphydryas editha]
MEFGKTNLDKFDETNFKQWKFQIKCALRAKGFDMNTPKPDGDAIQWNKDDGMAMFVLTSAMDLNQIALIENCESALEVMTKLESIYEQKSTTMTRECFYQYKMSPADSIAQHIAKVESLAKQLKEIGEVISETAIITKILSTLPQTVTSLCVRVVLMVSMLVNHSRNQTEDHSNQVMLYTVMSVDHSMCFPCKV